MIWTGINLNNKSLLVRPLKNRFFTHSKFTSRMGSTILITDRNVMANAYRKAEEVIQQGNSQYFEQVSMMFKTLLALFIRVINEKNKQVFYVFNAR